MVFIFVNVHIEDYKDFICGDTKRIKENKGLGLIERKRFRIIIIKLIIDYNNNKIHELINALF